MPNIAGAEQIRCDLTAGRFWLPLAPSLQESKTLKGQGLKSDQRYTPLRVCVDQRSAASAKGREEEFKAKVYDGAA